MACMAPSGARVVVTRPITSLALKLPSAFSSVLRVTSTPAEQRRAGGERDVGKFLQNLLLLVAGDEIEPRHFAGDGLDFARLETV